MQHDTVIRNGTIVTSTAIYQADVGIKGETITTIGHDLSGERVIEAQNRYVIPGAVDVHVHLSLDLGDGVVSSDDFYTGTRAAAFGGTTSVITFVHPAPHERMMQTFAARQADAAANAVIDYGFHMNISPHHINQLDDIAAVVEAGMPSFKVYMAYGLRLDDGQLLRALQAIHAVNGLPVVHAENWDVIQALMAQHRAAGHTEPKWHPVCRPPELEAEAVNRVIDLAAYVGVPVQIFHVGCKAATERIAAARARGLPVFAETCPQYLLLNDSAFEKAGIEGTYAVCAPPLRPEADRQFMWQALAQNQVQLVSTDHCPFMSALKARGLDDFSRIPGGIPSIEMRLAAIYSEGVIGGQLSLQRWVDVCCTTPAQLHRLTHKGHIAPGYDADIVIFDPNKRVTLSTETLHENIDHTPYAGIDITGWPVTTLCRGRVVVDDGDLQVDRGYGRYLHR